MALTTTLAPPPALPAVTVPLTDPAWRDYFTAQRAWTVALMALPTSGNAAIVALQAAARAAGAAWTAADGDAAPTGTGS